MDYDHEYTVIVRGRYFLLNKSQIVFDSPNFFTSCFLGDFSEAQSRTLKISRDPDLFQIVVNYLCGYTVLPLRDDFVPAFMTPSTALANLRIDAMFYQLDGLVDQCDEFTKSQSRVSSLPSRYLIVGTQYKHAEIEDIETQMSTAMISRAWRTWVTEDVLQKEPLLSIERPESRTGFNALREVAAVERFIQSQVPDFGPWRLVGWHIQRQVGTWEVSSQLMVVLEDTKNRKRTEPFESNL
ncbi:unnamed protein product [Rhizoctonia solani]|uniref:BTB domain-containing protein n=1 Tax=Rhizoctonia solani TaxID=456999 RepID=A0A8H2WPX9_9AGAM|nr:unnamed protein product [Rhizoctonia solani]